MTKNQKRGALFLLAGVGTIGALSIVSSRKSKGRTIASGTSRGLVRREEPSGLLDDLTSIPGKIFDGIADIVD